MSDATLDRTFVMLCDWRGHCIWSSDIGGRLTAGDLVWKNLTLESQRNAKDVLSRVVALRETQCIEVTNQEGERFRAWMWPLDSPDVAVCTLIVRIPSGLSRLTQREMDCLELLAQGIEIRSIARQLDIGVSTIHTHLKRAREKLGLTSIESLISFAARFCYPIDQPLHRQQA